MFFGLSQTELQLHLETPPLHHHFQLACLHSAVLSLQDPAWSCLVSLSLQRAILPNQQAAVPTTQHVQYTNLEFLPLRISALALLTYHTIIVCRGILTLILKQNYLQLTG